MLEAQNVLAALDAKPVLNQVNHAASHGTLEALVIVALVDGQLVQHTTLPAGHCDHSTALLMGGVTQANLALFYRPKPRQEPAVLS